jgi:hypothetical protein
MRNKFEELLNIKAHKTIKEDINAPDYWYSQLLSRYVVSQK